MHQCFFLVQMRSNFPLVRSVIRAKMTLYLKTCDKYAGLLSGEASFLTIVDSGPNLVPPGIGIVRCYIL